MARNGEMVIVDNSGRERERFKLVYGSVLNVRDGDAVKKGDILAEWDPYANPIIADLSSVVHFQDIEEGVTMSEQVDSVTGFSTKVITDSKGADSKPAILLKDANGQQLTFPGRDLPVRYVIRLAPSFLSLTVKRCTPGM